MKRLPGHLHALVVCLLVLAGPALPAAQAQPGPPPPGLLRLFLDCANAWCDLDYVRSEVTFVDHVRNREDADVHVLVTAESTGGGGAAYTMQFIGRGRFAGVEHRLLFTSSPTDTEHDIRANMVRTLKLGLVRYAADTASGRDIQISHRPPAGTAAAKTPAQGVDEPWNFWVFRASLRGNSSGESLQNTSGGSLGFSANRVTEAWKFTNSLSGSYRRSKYTLSEGETFTSITRSSSASSLAVKSLGPKWGGGGRASVSSSTYVNQDLALRVAPAVEWNYYPYEESTRRQLTFNYALGLNRFDYKEVTIFGKMSETVFDHALMVSLDLKQPWGSTSTSFEVSQYLNDLAKHSLLLYNSLDARLFKGFSLSMYGSVSRVRNQLYLPRGEATNEEILVRQRQLATSYQYYISIGFSYSFGSIYNNVVNTRFQGSSGGNYYY
jgi:hypothetical protein